MNKFLIAALALAAATGFTAVPAQAGIVLNGTNANGIVLNGMKLNGMKLNGIVLNGMKLNGIVLNGMKLNGYQLNGIVLNGVAKSGRMDETLAVTPKVRSVRLADGKLIPLN